MAMIHLSEIETYFAAVPHWCWPRVDPLVKSAPYLETPTLRLYIWISSTRLHVFWIKMTVSWEKQHARVPSKWFCFYFECCVKESRPATERWYVYRISLRSFIWPRRKNNAIMQVDYRDIEPYSWMLIFFFKRKKDSWHTRSYHMHVKLNQYIFLFIVLYSWKYWCNATKVGFGWNAYLRLDFLFCL